MSVLCLIANPNEPAIEPGLVASIHHETGGEINWLNPAVACEIVSPRAGKPADIARAAVAALPIDVALVPLANRRKKLLVADMDSTMIEQECIDELADAVGRKAEVSAITERAMRGELDFPGALHTRVAVLKGLSRATIEEIRREKITLAPGGRALVQTMKAFGAYTALVTGGFTVFADYIAKRIGFDEATANTLEFDGDVLTGTVSEPIFGRNGKFERLIKLVAERGIHVSEAIAVGDGANDLDMIRAAGLGVAMHAKPAVAAEAGVRIDHGDLTALLYLQGYSEDDFVR
jgi:phosphoserine phosphatase